MAEAALDELHTAKNSPSTRGAYGENVSSVTIKQRIRTIIENEDARKPLSDARIVRRLQDDGLVLARRTIAKYRDELRMPTSSRRKVSA